MDVTQMASTGHVLTANNHGDILVWRPEELEPRRLAFGDAGWLGAQTRATLVWAR